MLVSFGQHFEKLPTHPACPFPDTSLPQALTLPCPAPSMRLNRDPHPPLGSLLTVFFQLLVILQNSPLVDEALLF